MIVKDRKQFVIEILAGLVCGLVLFALYNSSLHTVDSQRLIIVESMSDSDVRNAILKITPVGTSEGDCLNLIYKCIKCDPKSVSQNDFQGAPIGTEKAIGNRTVCLIVRFANLLSPFTHQEMFVFWAFDKERRLLDVVIERELVGL
jgi:hypothetical protein